MASLTQNLTTAATSAVLTLGDGDSQAIIQISGTYGTVTGEIEGSTNGESYSTIVALNLATNTHVTTTVSPSDNTTYMWMVNTGGLTKVRFRMTAIASGDVDVHIQSGNYQVPPAQIPVTVSTGTQSYTGDVTLASGSNLIFSGTTGQSEIVLTDNLADAMSLKISGGADLLVAVTTDSAEQLTVGVDAVTLDDVDFGLGTGVDALLRWSTGDASNHAAVLALGDSSQALHITDKAAVATDWNISGTTDPNVYVHSNTTPATDYLRLGGHSGTAADIDVVGGATLQLQIDGTSEVTMTATQLNVLDGNSLVVGGSTPQVISDGDGATNLTPTVQFLGTAKADASVLIGSWNTTNTATVAPSLNFLKSGHGTIGSSTIVASGEVLGEITWFGDDGADYEAPACQLQGVVAATPGAGDMPGALLVRCTTDGGEALAEVGRFSVAAGLTLGLTGTTTGKLTMAGATSGAVTISAADAAGTWTLQLPADDGDAGEQLQTNGSGVTTWEAAGSLRAIKNVVSEVSDRAQAVLDRLTGVGVYEFTYKEKGRPTTGDYETAYVGVMADEVPEVMHHGGRIFSPVSAFGHAVLAMKALAARCDAQDERIRELESRLA